MSRPDSSDRSAACTSSSPSALASGHSEVAIGTRLAPGSRVLRGPKREFISRSYNRILRVALGARFSDAQCGFKAVRADAAAQLLPQIQDQGWFFDTERLVAAQRNGMRIHEVAVDWTDDPDSRVDIVSTALTDLRGVARLRLATPLARFLLIGGREGLIRAACAGAGVYLLALALTDGALRLLGGLDPHPAKLLEVTVLVAASAAATVTRYVALRTWVFARGHRSPAVLRAAPR